MSDDVQGWVGQTLASGRYRVDAKLGEGGMGFVYRVWDRNIDTDLVVKVPRRMMLEEPEFAERFAREIRSLVKLSHPNIVKVTDVGTHGELPFAVMQFLEGGDLEGKLPRRKDGRIVPSQPSTLAGWLPGIASALDYIHRQGYIHRDVKPGNILFDGQGHAFLSDFGVAKVLGDVATSGKRGGTLTGAGMVVGTPEYMARELIMGEPFDGRVDQYALAVTVYEVLCGRKPFLGETSTAIMVRQTSEPPPRMTELEASGYHTLIPLILRGLAKNPAERYPTCGAFAQAVIAAAATLPAAPQGLVESGIKTSLPCPACGRGLNIPPAALANPAVIQGKKARCPGCQVALRFASEGIAVHLADPSAEPASTGSGTMVLTAPGRTGSIPVPFATAPTAPIAATMKLTSVARPPSGQAPAVTEVLPERAPIGGGPVPETGTAQPSGKGKVWLIVAGVASAAAILAIAAIVLLTGGPPTAEPHNIPGPLSSSSKSSGTVYNSLASGSGPTMKPASKAATRVNLAAANAAARKAVVEKRVPPPRNEPKPAPEPTPKTEPTPEPVPAPTPEPTPAPSLLDKNVEPENEPPPPALGVVEKKIPFEKLALDPARYEGGLVIPNDILGVRPEPVSRPGVYEGLEVQWRRSDPSAPKSNIRLDIVTTEGIADRLRELCANRTLRLPQYYAIMNIRVKKNRERPGSFLGVVEQLELLGEWDQIKILKKDYAHAFPTLVITDQGSNLIHNKGERWEDRLGPQVYSMHNRLKKMSNAQQAAMLNQIQSAVNQQTATFARQRQAEYNQTFREVFGK
jgi:serine/threonine-protein kinase